MKSLLLAVLLLGLVAVLKAQEAPLDDQEDFSGIWYAKAMVHNGSLPNHKIPREVFPVRIISLEGGDLEVTVTFWKKQHCHEFKFILRKTEEPGKYTTSQLLTHKDPKTGKGVHDQKVVHVEKTSVKDHYIFYCESLHNGKSVGFGKLMAEHHPSKLPHLLTARDPEENPEAMEDFGKFIRRMGLREENMFVPENRVMSVLMKVTRGGYPGLRQLSQPAAKARLGHSCTTTLLDQTSH
ncbi:Odorant-binding protein 2a [Apodemus speciosus]|uniref:Odorant-binding protein 2a n=1 Tax=Apodemus speciosus TaxID=105296 RepID=A0ABQ0EGJ8_APOSI